jgi:hypothetical protein
LGFSQGVKLADCGGTFIDYTDVSNSLLSRDYKGLTTYEKTGVIEYG